MGSFKKFYYVVLDGNGNVVTKGYTFSRKMSNGIVNGLLNTNPTFTGKVDSDQARVWAI